MLERMKRYKGHQSDRPSTTTPKKPRKKFGGVGFLKYLLGNSKKGASGQSAISSERSTRSRSFIRSIKQVKPPDTCGPDWEAPNPSSTYHHSGIAESLPTAPIAASPYQVYVLQETVASGRISSQPLGDSSRRSYKSLDVPRPTLPGPSVIRSRSQVRPETGLATLSQEPTTSLRPHSTSYPSRPPPLRNRPSTFNSAVPPPQTFLSVTPSTSSSSLASEYDTPNKPGDFEFQTSQARAPYDQPSSIPSRFPSTVKPTDGLTGEAERKPRLTHSLSHRVALSQVFMYQARMSDRPVDHAESTPPISGSGFLLELEGVEPQNVQGTNSRGIQVRRATTSFATNAPGPPRLFRSMTVARSQHPGLATA